MKCPYCPSTETQVINTRPTKNHGAIWRRRKCLKCAEVFSTYESPSLEYLVVKKRSGKTTRYLSYKLFASIYDAAAGGKHVDRGDAATLAETALREIEHKLLVSGKEVVSTTELIDHATDALEGRDLGACYRYAAFSPHRGMKFGI